jgi:AraC-like DNA-binding protein
LDCLGPNVKIIFPEAKSLRGLFHDFQITPFYLAFVFHSRTTQESFLTDLTCSPAWVRGVLETLVAAGLDAPALCQQAGLPSQCAAQEGMGCSGDQLTLLWELAEAQSQDPAIAISGQQTAKPAIFGIVGYAMMASPDLLGALERLIRFVRMISELAIIDITPQGDCYRLRLELFAGQRPVGKHRFEFDCLTLLTFFRWVVGGKLSPKTVEFIHEAPLNPQAYVDTFGCPVNFGSTFNGMVFKKDDLRMPLPTSNTLLLDIHDRFAEQELAQRGNKHMTIKVRDMIVQNLPDGEPKREAIASAMCMTERTLSRRLQNEGTSFQDLLNDTRRKLALQYLRQPSLTLAEVAYLLGFSDQSTFFRACKRWFEVPPGQLRERISR